MNQFWFELFVGLVESGEIQATREVKDDFGNLCSVADYVTGGTMYTIEYNSEEEATVINLTGARAYLYRPE